METGFHNALLFVKIKRQRKILMGKLIKVFMLQRGELFERSKLNGG